MTPVASFIMHTQGGKREAFVYLQLVSALAARRCTGGCLLNRLCGVIWNTDNVSLKRETFFHSWNILRLWVSSKIVISLLLKGGLICMGETRKVHKIFNVNLKGRNYLEE